MLGPLTLEITLTLAAVVVLLLGSSWRVRRGRSRARATGSSGTRERMARLEAENDCLRASLEQARIDLSYLVDRIESHADDRHPTFLARARQMFRIRSPSARIVSIGSHLSRRGRTRRPDRTRPPENFALKALENRVRAGRSISPQGRRQSRPPVSLPRLKVVPPGPDHHGPDHHGPDHHPPEHRSDQRSGDSSRGTGDVE